MFIAAGVLAAMNGVSPLPEQPWPPGVALPAGVAVEEVYRRQFDLCDEQGTPLGRASQSARCVGDPNLVTALRRLPGGPIAYVSKLAVDLDGSLFACGPDHGRMDQCPTSLMLRDPDGHEVPVDADAVPYVVIPKAGPDEHVGEFTQLTGVNVGDFGVVILGKHVVSVIVADTGPPDKLGEGSLALHRALGHEQCATKSDAGICNRVDNEGESITSGVTTILFPGSARNDLTPVNISAITRYEGQRLLAAARRRFANDR